MKILPRSSRYGWPLFARLLFFLLPLTLLIWIVFAVFGFKYIANRAREGFVDTNMKIVRGIAQQSVTNINYSDFFQLKRTLSDFFDDSYMDCIAIYSRKGIALAVYPSDLSSDILGELQTAIHADDTGAAQTARLMDGRFLIYQNISDMEGKNLGRVVMLGSTAPIRQSIKSQVVIYALLGAALLVINVLLIMYFARRVTRPFTRLTRALKAAGGEGVSTIPQDDRAHVLGTSACSEVALFYDTYRRLMTNLGEHQKRERLMAIQASIGNIASHLSHDMRTPLHNIRTFLSALPDVEDSDLSQLKNGAVRSVQKLIGMTEELVDYAKSGRVSPVPTKLYAMLTDVIKEMSSTVLEKEITLELNCPKDIEADLDPNKMNRVFSNIVLNAVQAIRESGHHITVSARYSGNVLVVSIADDGSGIEKQYIPRLFDSSFTYGKRRGTGLGLSYCQKVVQAHHGSIHVESELGRGSVFSIMLPLRHKKRESVEKEEVSFVEPVFAAPNFPHKGVLVVDDDPSILAHWRMLFRKISLVPIESTSLEDLKLQELDFNRIDTAIVDYQFEGSAWDGLDVLAFLKERGVERIYMCTGFYQDEDLIRRATSLGAIKMLPKPFDETVLSYFV